MHNLNITNPSKGQISIVGQEITEVPEDLGDKHGEDTTILDLSHNLIVTLNHLDKFQKLTSLIVDSNNLSSNQSFPVINTMNTLCVNDNDIKDLEEFLGILKKSFPNLTYLSMLKNPACPNYFIGKDQEDYKRYRYYVLYHIPKLKFLDSSPVNEEEKKEAMRVGAFMKVARPKDQEENEENEEGEGEGEGEDENDGLSNVGQTKTSVGVCRYVYYGKHSEGNRFILNDDL
eukprot:TRINITY_DN12628_c0_g1_i1.p1 TRINITY_DN12628_c0_g1~~TRINITY_DN12628_c0_g1_i1.p1  ORF type:complete len:231 (+),score=72.64 TRINITY_DN12628_c0_g1_i1:44-736(+)